MAGFGVAAAALGALSAASSLGNTALQWGAQRNLNEQTFDQNLTEMYRQFLYDKHLQEYQMDFNSSEAQKSRDWQEYMSNTSYQRQVADMLAAGINPASLSGTAGGASTPSASPASAGAGSVGAPKAGSSGIGVDNSFGHFISSAVNGLLAKDRDAAKYLADEIRDNAKHAHAMEEIYEKYKFDVARKLLDEGSLIEKENPFNEL